MTLEDKRPYAASAGSVAVITGGSSGIGTVMARTLAEAGMRVLLVGRNAERTERAAALCGERAEPLVADLATSAGCSELLADIHRRTGRVDVLVNNAGLINRRRRVTAEGLEETFAVNHLGYFRMALGLLDLLRAAAPARVVNTASQAHHGPGLDFSDLQLTRRYNPWRAYQRSKLCNLLFSYEAARRWEGSGVTCNAFHPGVVGTGIVRSMPWPLPALWRLFTKTPEEGADTGSYLALAPELAGVSGAYWIRRKQRSSSEPSRDLAAAEKLWQYSESLD